MSDQKPLTIEILGESNGTHPVVLDRVIGGTVYLEEAKRIGHRLFAITDGETSPEGFRILGPRHRVVYEWHVGGHETTRSYAE
jgi:hypothetical protein